MIFINELSASTVLALVLFTFPLLSDLYINGNPFNRPEYPTIEIKPDLNLDSKFNNLLSNSFIDSREVLEKSSLIFEKISIIYHLEGSNFSFLNF